MKNKLVQITNKSTFVESVPWPDGLINNEIFDENKDYDKDVIFVISNWTINSNKNILHKLLDAGHKVIVDSLWEASCDNGYELWKQYKENVLVMYCGTGNIYPDCESVCYVPNFFWIREHLYNKLHGLDKYVPKRTNKKFFFMPIRVEKYPRDVIYNELSKYNAIISYFDKGIELPLDDNSFVDDAHFDRSFNPAWYNDTYFSIAVETEISATDEEKIHDSDFAFNLNDNSLFLTEKIFKPIAFSHPFMVFGTCGMKSRLVELGFETFDHLFGLEYDNVQSMHERIECIKHNIDYFNTGTYLNPRTSEMIRHNKEHFYNEAVINRLIKDELLDPIEEFANG